MLAPTGGTVAVASAAGPAGVAVSAGMAASAEDVVLQVRDVSFRYGSGGLILDDISLEVRAGETLGIIGTSGCGKSTLLRLVAGLEHVTVGAIDVRAREHIDGAVTTSRSKPVMVFQDLALLPWRTVTGNVQLGLELLGMPRSQRRERAAEVLATVGMTDHAQQLPYQLSGGMKQRAALARALAVNPPVLLLDEPFAALDAQTRLIMQAEVSEITSKIGCTSVLVTHAIDEAVFMSDRILVLSPRPGRLTAAVTVDLPRPRGLEVRATETFKRLVDEIFDTLKPDLVNDVSRRSR
jgi:NitT/TauT family transport system ATP-binding protein